MTPRAAMRDTLSRERGEPGGRVHRALPFPRARHWWSVATCASTLVLIFIGGLVTSTGSGLAVPDWPLSYGMLMPPMVGGVFYEHGHRMAATFVGLLTLVLAVWTARREPRAGVRKLAWGALAAVVVQGLLGGLTVIFLLPTSVSVLHACLAQAFFCLTIALALATSREWIEAGPPAEDVASVRTAAGLATTVVFAQLLLGALMRHTGAGLAISDFPLALGRVVPPLDSAPVTLHFLHRVGAVAVVAAALWLARQARRSRDRRFSRPATLLLVLVALQVGLGAATVLTGKAVLPTTAHVATGAAVLGLSWLLTLRARLHLRRPQAMAVLTAPLPDAAPTP
ncbi:MAG TPA: COX15/CtaA family protein [Vicinamibacteria bacterium]|nr:COX15/CtaA family protein [Vicinamibacteria bacterium]